MMTTVYATCDGANVDASTGQCSAVVWVDGSPTLLPPLSVGDGGTIAMAIVAVWALAFGVNAVCRVISGA